jgi:hypothetical protein
MSAMTSQNSTHTTTPSANVDPAISDIVTDVSKRFGAQGLCDLIALAREELSQAEAALKEVSDHGGLADHEG